MIILKEFGKKINKNWWIFSLIFINFNIVLNFLLYVFNIRFRLGVIIFIIGGAITSLIVGIIQLIYKNNFNVRKSVLLILISIIPLIILIDLFLPFLAFRGNTEYVKEHVVSLNDKKYLAQVNAKDYVSVNYYKYYGLFLSSTKVKVHGDFGKGCYDPFEDRELVEEVLYTYYDRNGTAIREIKTDGNNKELDSKLLIKDEDIKENEDLHEDYLLPETEKILYEKSFGNTVLRFGFVDNVLGQNMLVNVLRSTDGGKNFYSISEENILVSLEAKFIFLNENLGFIARTGLLQVNNNDTNRLYVTNDGGRTFSEASFNLEIENVEYIRIDEMPYLGNDKLKIVCSYKLNNSFRKKLVFISDDNGYTWNLEEN